ncbi:Sec-independent protein translocase protein TatB [Rhodococcus sp. IEGM 1401]|uniref:Sec-independent protein translocase protein TatB n=1 Tax=unclassified Rhodococcus (in: high G+C Gram-positive bacteria) TaxID=192944 RepID=UPI0022B49C02|nr:MULTISPECIES: Sec-independent protein translocase protein TatB [unclassified Rhodococcus (in: high G+C Gram-positive bacteria)]MCZ4561993.1 Sec-independent protein translocase protein TatB [Rhodococcus sp. IEGM 1401]MDI9922767.1 Sec-independent protein translocase protein TatB [Rhodococcus sp. IEGM 1372]MDV8034488.1 Sec-independent protein translocase protein TatB [Rhodococcus sp. IEGM 1414]
MFGNIGWGELVILLVAALVILGPDRLPGAISWVSKSIRQVKDYANGASQQLKDELGTDFEDLRKPLADLNQLRGMTPRAVITKHLLDGDDSVFKNPLDDTFKGKPFETKPKNVGGPTRQTGTARSGVSMSKNEPKLSAGDTPPIDADAT